MPHTKPQPKKDRQLNIRISRSEQLRLREIAESQGHTLASYARFVLRQQANKAPQRA